MSKHDLDVLDRKLAKLPHEVLPPRDLWPDIAATLAHEAESTTRRPHTVQRLATQVRRFADNRLWQLAAVLLLMATASVSTYLLAQRGLQGQIAEARRQVIQQLQPVVNATPASFGYQRLGLDYARTHAELDAQFARYLTTLPPAERVKVERSLADLRRVAKDLSARLAEHPSDQLLQELLLSTYQNELGLLTRVTDLGATSALGADL